MDEPSRLGEQPLQPGDDVGLVADVSLHDVDRVVEDLVDRQRDGAMNRLHTLLSRVRFLGHKQLENTARYSQVATKLLQEVRGPLEYLEINPPA